MPFHLTIVVHRQILLAGEKKREEKPETSSWRLIWSIPEHKLNSMFVAGTFLGIRESKKYIRLCESK